MFVSLKMHSLLALLTLAAAQTAPVPVPLAMIHGTDKDFVPLAGAVVGAQAANGGSSSNAAWIGVAVIVGILGMVAAYFVGYYVGSVTSRREAITVSAHAHAPVLASGMHAPQTPATAAAVSSAHVHNLAASPAGAATNVGAAVHRQTGGMVPHSLAMSLQMQPQQHHHHHFAGAQLPLASEQAYVNPYQIKTVKFH